MARLPNIESEQSKLTTVLRAMSNAKRLRILNELADGRERSVSELEGVIASLSQSALSQHLARLRRANIVRTRHESQTIFYSIDDADVLRIIRLLGHTIMMTRSCSAPNIELRRHEPPVWLQPLLGTGGPDDLLRPQDIPVACLGVVLLTLA